MLYLDIISINNIDAVDVYHITININQLSMILMIKASSMLCININKIISINIIVDINILYCYWDIINIIVIQSLIDEHWVFIWMQTNNSPCQQSNNPPCPCQQLIVQFDCWFHFLVFFEQTPKVISHWWEITLFAHKNDSWILYHQSNNDASVCLSVSQLLNCRRSTARMY